LSSILFLFLIITSHSDTMVNFTVVMEVLSDFDYWDALITSEASYMNLALLLNFLAH